MADADDFNNFVNSNLQLLADVEPGTQIILTDNISEQEEENVNIIATAFNAQEQAENNESLDDFEAQQITHRHCTLQNSRIDYLSSKKYKDLTKEQTKWAVNIFRGKCCTFHSIFTLFY